MTDRMTPEQRHRCMSHIRSKDTKPELKVRRVKGTGTCPATLDIKYLPHGLYFLRATHPDGRREVEAFVKK